MSAHDLAEDEAIHHVPYRTYINVWLILMGLTAVTVGAALLDLKQMAVFTASCTRCGDGSKMAIAQRRRITNASRPSRRYQVSRRVGVLSRSTGNAR